MAANKIPMHDQNFKNLILDYPRESLRFFADQEADQVHLAKITPIRQEQLKQRPGDRYRELDTPLLLEWPGGERAALLFVVEEESETRKFSIYRLAHYCLDISELMGIHRVVPVVIFLNPGSRPDRLSLGGDHAVYLDFHYLSCALKGLSARDHFESNNLVVRLNLPNMRYTEADRLAVYAAAQAGLAQLEPDTERQLKYADFIDYYADLSTEEIDTYRTTYLTKQGDVMGLAQILRQEGREEGRQEGKEEGRQEGKEEGKQEGKQEGEATLLIRLLELRFGKLDDMTRQRIKQADADILLVWGERVLSATTLDAVFTDSTPQSP